MKLTFQNKIQKLVVTGVFTAVLAVLSQLSIPVSYTHLDVYKRQQ